MSDHLFNARLFLFGGAALTVGGLILWLILPISSTLPPYLVTGLLALGYGVVCRWPGLFSRRPKS